MKGTICAVLKSGGDFGPAHGRFLERQVREHYPDWEWRLYSDMADCPYRLRLGLPRWWSKYEAYADPTLKGPVLMLDLDVVIIKQWLPPPEHVGSTILCRDTNRIVIPGGPPQYIGAFCYLQEADRKLLADDFFANPVKAMATKNSDDQPRLSRILPHAIAVQHLDPDAIALFKVHVASMGLQPGNKIVLFHGLPRPWDFGAPWVPTLE